jgi:transcriptional regulator with XRE-family HTH domain
LQLSADLAKLLVDERKTLGLTQTEFGDQLGMSQSGVGTWEAGGRNLGHLHVHQIEAAEAALNLPKGNLLRRLGLVDETVDFETFVMAHPELSPDLKEAFCSIYRLFMSKDGGLPEGGVNQ